MHQVLVVYNLELDNKYNHLVNNKFLNMDQEVNKFHMIKLVEYLDNKVLVNNPVHSTDQVIKRQIKIL